MISFQQFLHESHLHESSYGTTCNACGAKMDSIGRDAAAKAKAARQQKTALCNDCRDAGYHYDGTKLVKPSKPSGYKQVGHDASVNLLDKTGLPGIKTYVQDFDVYQSGDKYYAKLPTDAQKGFGLGQWVEVKKMDRLSGKSYTYQIVKTTPEIIKKAKRLELMLMQLALLEGVGRPRYAR